MPKDTSEKIYLNPSIPRESRLARYLEESSARSGIAKSQLLVWFATEYVRLVVDGSGVGPTAPVKVEPVGLAQTMGQHIRTLDMKGGGEPNFDSFGDPD